jgi:Fe-S cluster biogenesis protein NfuA
MIERAAVERRVEELARLMNTHGGGLELESLSDDGAVRVRFTGMCTGCTFRPVTMVGTVRRALAAVPGVKRVEAAGTRISAEAEERLAAALALSPSPWNQARSG